MATLIEKRKHERLPCGLDIHIPLRGRLIKARMSDISEAGAMFLSEESIAPMVEYEISLVLKPKSEPIISKAVVVWSKKIKKNLYPVKKSFNVIYATGLFFQGLSKKARMRIRRFLGLKKS